MSDNRLEDLIIIFIPNIVIHNGPTFRQTELLQLTGQGLAVNIMLRCTGENEAEHCHTSFDIAAFYEIERHELTFSSKQCIASMTVS